MSGPALPAGLADALEALTELQALARAGRLNPAHALALAGRVKAPLKAFESWAETALFVEAMQLEATQSGPASPAPNTPHRLIVFDGGRP